MSKRTIIISAVLAVLAFPAYYIYTNYISPLEKRIENRFSENLFLLQHDYAYKVTAETANGPMSVYLVKDEGNQFDVWEPGNTGNRLYASALMMDSSGISITSRYAAEPWNNPDDIKSIKKLIASQTGINEEDIKVAGRTIRLTIRPVSLIGTGNSTEIECVRYTSENQPEATAFIGRKNRQSVLPFGDIDLGSNYPQFRKEDKTLYVLTIPAYDYSVSLPMKPLITNVRSLGDDDYGTVFSEPATQIAEGSPVFDARLNLVGVYTSVSPINKPHYVSHYVRSYVAPSLIAESVLGDIVKDIDSLPVIPEVIKIPDVTPVSYDVDGVEFPFIAEESWTMLEQKTSATDGIHPESDPSMTNFATGSHTFNQQKARLRIKIDGDGPAEIGLMTDKHGFVQVDYAGKISKSGTIDLGVLEGSYTISVLHNDQTRVRFVFERFE